MQLLLDEIPPEIAYEILQFIPESDRINNMLNIVGENHHWLNYAPILRSIILSKNLPLETITVYNKKVPLEIRVPTNTTSTELNLSIENNRDTVRKIAFLSKICITEVICALSKCPNLTSLRAWNTRELITYPQIYTGTLKEIELMSESKFTDAEIRIIAKNCHSLKKLKLISCKSINNLSPLTQCKNLDTFISRDFRINAPGVNNLSPVLPQLEKLEIDSEFSMNNYMIIKNGEYPKMREICFTPKYNNHNRCKFPNVNKINCRKGRINHDMFNPEMITELHISNYVGNITFAEKSPNLKILKIYDSHINTVTFSNFVKCKKLESLKLLSSHFDNIDGFISQLQNLREITLPRCPSSDYRRILYKLSPKLRKITIIAGSSQFHDEHVSIIAYRCPDLRIANFSNTSVTAMAVSHLAESRMITAINLARTKTLEDVYHYAAKIPSLMELDLRGCNITILKSHRNNIHLIYE